VLLLAFGLTQYRQLFSLPFLNDDYVFLEKVRGLSFASLWQRRDLTFGFYRPWSREFHYWALMHAFGNSELPYHLVNLGLWIALLVAYLSLAIDLLGVVNARFALAGVLASGIWGSPLLWVAGAQDLWMILFGLFFLLSVRRGRLLLASLFLGLALLSKETAAVLPAIASAYLVTIGGKSLKEALLKSWPYWAILLAWSILHPTFVGHVLGHSYQLAEVQTRPGMPAVATKTLLAQVNMDPLPRPEFGWARILPTACLGAAILAALLLPAVLTPRKPSTQRHAEGSDTRAVRKFAAAWTVIGWIPFLAPSIGWHAYYGALGSLGFWVLVSTFVGRAPKVALVLFMALGLLREARAATPSWDWGTDWYQQRAGWLLSSIRTRLRALHPSFPHGSRLFFARIPNNIGFLNGDGPAVRIWYGDSTLRAVLFSNYRPRENGTQVAPDYFFRFDSTRVLVELTPGPEELNAVLADNPDWLDDHFKLATLFVQSGDVARAGTEYAKIARAFPARRDCALYAAVCLDAVGQAREAEPLFAAARASFPDEESFRRTVDQLKHSLPTTRRDTP